MASRKPLVLLILDGFGYREEPAHNAIANAHTPQWTHWWATQPHMLLDASGKAVGLPDGQMGNSEVGHMHMGAGRVIPQDFTRINDAIMDGSFAQNPVFHALIQDLKSHGKALHVMGLLSPGGVHSHEAHLFAFLKCCQSLEFSNVYLHLFLDGRDTPPQSARGSLDALQQYLQTNPVAQIHSITGRYFAMDRDQRWERTQPVYELLTEHSAHRTFGNALDALDWYYQQSIHDEFIPPTLIGHGNPITDGDGIFFFNFRADRTRQLTQALILDEFSGFIRHKRPKLSQFISMTQYSKQLPTIPIFPPLHLTHTLGEIIAQAGLKQLRIAETEKYAHVTFFLNGGQEGVYPNEDRVLIPSPKVATYDLQPEMSAPLVTQKIVEAIEHQSYDVIIANYANADMVGHSGIYSATIQAIECLDQCLHDIGNALNKVEGQLLITADHGNAEMMYDETTKQPHTAHTADLVPLLYIGGDWHFNRPLGSLIDIAPTLLTLLGITPPQEMTGQVLLTRNHHA